MKPFVTLGTAFLFLSLGTFVPVFAQQGQEEGKPEQKPQHAKQQNQDKSKQQDKQQHEKSNQPAATAQPPQQEPQNKPAEPRPAAEQKGDSQQTQQDQNKQPAATAQRAQPQNQNKHQQEHAQQRDQNKQPQQQDAQRQNIQQPVHHTQEEQHAQQAAWQEHRSQNWDSDHRTWQQRGGYIGYRIPDDRFRVNFGPEHRFVIYRQPYMVVGGFPRFQYGGYWFNLVDPWPGAWARNWYETDDVYVAYENNGYYMYNRRYPTVGLAINVSF